MQIIACKTWKALDCLNYGTLWVQYSHLTLSEPTYQKDDLQTTL